MDTGQRLFLGTVTALLLFIGLYLLILETRIIANMFEVVRNEIKEEEIYQQYYSEDSEKVSYTELVAILLNTLEYDIVVDGISISMDEHNSDRISGYQLKNCDYSKEYHYDEHGKIILISYISKE